MKTGFPYAVGSVKKEVDAIFSEMRYWPKGLYFRSSAHKEFLLEFGQRVEGGRCLDLGCGAEPRYRSFIELHGLEWHGADVFDPSPALAPYRRAAEDRLDFEDGFFDAVCAFNVIEHFTSPESMFREIHRCLKRGGVFCGACAFWEMEHGSYFHFSHKGLSEMLRRHGFETLSLKPSEYSGLVLSSQRFFGGDGRIHDGSPRATVFSRIVCNLNLAPFLVMNAFELARRAFTRHAADPFRDCATLYFYARKS